MHNKEKIIEEKYKDILKRKSEGYVTDYSDCGEIYHTLNYFKECVSKPRYWLEKLTSLEFSEGDVFYAREDIKGAYDDTVRIMSYGDKWLWEEWVLVINLRTSLEMIKDFFKFRGFYFPTLDLQGLCEEMKESAATRKNKKTVEEAARSIDKNSLLPVVDIWFEADRREEYLISIH